MKGTSAGDVTTAKARRLFNLFLFFFFNLKQVHKSERGALQEETSTLYGRVQSVWRPIADSEFVSWSAQRRRWAISPFHDDRADADWGLCKNSPMDLHGQERIRVSGDKPSRAG